MDITLVIKTIMGLVVILAIVLFLFIHSLKQKKQKKLQSKKKSTKTNSVKNVKSDDLESLKNIIKNKSSSLSQLKEAVDTIIKYHGKIHPKLGSRIHPDFDIYEKILFLLCIHPNADKNVVLRLNRELEKLNPQYKAEINNAITKGLNSRVVVT